MQNETDSIVRLKCESCGAEVVVNTISSLQMKCPWCRNVLSINTAQKNGSVPDGILPFKISKEEASNIMKEYLSDKKFFAAPKFKKELNLEEIKGVYFPYFIVDVNANVEFEAIAEKTLLNEPNKTLGRKKEYQEIERYLLKKRFQITIDNHILESKSTQLKYDWEESTNNIMNAILPFDTEDASVFDANYLSDYIAIRRDLNNEVLNEKLEEEIQTISINSLIEDLNNYDRGFKTKKNQVFVRGTSWKSIYCPIWLYSYRHIYKGKPQMNYIAVNARTGKVMGSIPMSAPLLYLEMAITAGIFSLISTMLSFLLPPLMLLTPLFLILWFYIPIKIVNKYTNYTEKYKMEEKKGILSNMESEEEKMGNSRAYDSHMIDADYYPKKRGRDK